MEEDGGGWTLRALKCDAERGGQLLIRVFFLNRILLKYLSRAHHPLNGLLGIIPYKISIDSTSVSYSRSIDQLG